LATESHSILAKWRNHFYQILNEHGFIDIRHNKVQKAEPLVPKPSAFEVEITIEKLKRHKSPGTDKIPAELIKVGGRAIRSQNHKFINSICNKEEFPEQWKESIIVHVSKKGDTTDFSNCTGISLLLNIYKISSNYALKVNSIWRGNY
jgi:hypothetical protein